MKRIYWTCPVCNGNFDYGEKCDCGETIQETPGVAECLDPVEEVKNEKEKSIESLITAVENMRISFDNYRKAMNESITAFNKAIKEAGENADG